MNVNQIVDVFNSEEEPKTFTTLTEDGLELECEILFSFESNQTGKNYIVYTDNSLDEEGNTKVFASIFDPSGNTTDLIPIETEEEWEIIETMLGVLSDPEGYGEEIFEQLRECYTPEQIDTILSAVGAMPASDAIDQLIDWALRLDEYLKNQIQ